MAAHRDQNITITDREENITMSNTKFWIACLALIGVGAAALIGLPPVVEASNTTAGTPPVYFETGAGSEEAPTNLVDTPALPGEDAPAEDPREAAPVTPVPGSEKPKAAPAPAPGQKAPAPKPSTPPVSAPAPTKPPVVTPPAPKPSTPPAPPAPSPTPTTPPAPEPTKPPAPPAPVLNPVPYKNLTFAAPEHDPDGNWTRRIRVNDYYMPGCGGSSMFFTYSQATSRGGTVVVSRVYYFDVRFESDFANPLHGFKASIYVCDI